MILKRLSLAAMLALTTTFAVAAEGTPSAPGTVLYIISPAPGMEVSSPVTIRFGLVGMGIAPAEVEYENTGHHHLLIDRPPFGEGEFGAEEFTLAIPKDEHHYHFGKGQTEVTMEMTPGKHTLQLVLGDYAHTPHVPPVYSDVITITVK